MESAIEGVLTDDLQSAKVSTRLKEQELLTRLGQINGKDTWDAVPVIENLKVSRSGVVSGTQASYLLTELTSNWASSRWHNLALSESAAAEAKNDETIFGHGLELKLSAMWPALVARYREEEADQLAGDDSGIRDHALMMLVGRVFYAGVTAGRREQGSRNRFDELILDNPFQMTIRDASVASGRAGEAC